MKVAIYSRKSKYTGKGDSIGNQIQMCKDYIENLYKNKKIEYSIYEDEGFSGKNTNRPEFQKLLNDIKKEKFNVLICYRLDRISRNVADFSSTLDELQVYGVDFVSIREQFDTTSPMGRAMIYIASVFAQLERETIAERVRDNMIELAKNGQWLGGSPPLGYSRKRETCYDENGNEKAISFLVQEPDEVKLVQLLYDTYLKLGSIHQTERYLMNNGICAPSGKLFAASTMHKILKNPLYAKSSDEILKYLEADGINVFGSPDGIHGILEYNRTSVIIRDGKKTNPFKDKSEWIAAVSKRCEGFIDPDTWLKTQKQLKTNSALSPNLGKTNNALLTSKLKCKCCGSSMGVALGRRLNETGLCKVYYRCNLKRRSSGHLCNSKNLIGDKVDECVLDSLVEMAKNKKAFLDRILKSKKENKKLKEDKFKKSTLEKQIANKTKQLNGLLDKLSVADDLLDIFMNKIRSLKSEISQLEENLKSIGENIENNSSELYDIEFINAVLDKCVNIKNESIESKRRIINFLIEEIIYDSETELLEIYPIGSGGNKKKRYNTFIKEITNDPLLLHFYSRTSWTAY
ncbi:recombinase family protein [Clostridium beijerinckii]|uniref:recombinase family protein n=2 Tax=Clostridium TaxID=1485 RepID=UPI001EEF454F|nr:recombinase family protein [Clostridium beijerinckii]